MRELYKNIILLVEYLFLASALAGFYFLSPFNKWHDICYPVYGWIGAISLICYGVFALGWMLIALNKYEHTMIVFCISSWFLLMYIIPVTSTNSVCFDEIEKKSRGIKYYMYLNILYSVAGILLLNFYIMYKICAHCMRHCYPDVPAIQREGV